MSHERQFLKDLLKPEQIADLYFTDNGFGSRRLKTMVDKFIRTTAEQIKLLKDIRNLSIAEADEGKMMAGLHLAESAQKEIARAVTDLSYILDEYYSTHIADFPKALESAGIDPERVWISDPQNGGKPCTHGAFSLGKYFKDRLQTAVSVEKH